MVREKLPELIEQYQSYGYSIALQIMRDKHDAEEIVQDVFLKLHNGALDSFKESNDFRPWFARVVANMAKDVLRKKKRRSGHISLEDQEEKLQISSKDRNPLDQLVGGSVLEQVNVEMSRLRPIDRAYMELVLSGHSYEDISYLTGLPMGTVKSRINWIRKRLGRNVFNRSFSYRNARG